MRPIPAKRRPSRHRNLSGIPSRANAFYLCSRFQAEGIKAKIDTPPAASGYLVSVYRLSVKKAKEILSQCGVELQDDEAT